MVSCCACGNQCDEHSTSYKTSGRCFKCDTGELAALSVIHQCAWCTVILSPTPYNQGKKMALKPNASHGMCVPCGKTFIGNAKKGRTRKRIRKFVNKFFTPILAVLHAFPVSRGL